MLSWVTEVRNMGNKYIQIVGFIIIIGIIWHFGNPESAVVTAVVVAIWEFLKPSH